MIVAATTTAVILAVAPVEVARVQVDEMAIFVQAELIELRGPGDVSFSLSSAKQPIVDMADVPEVDVKPQTANRLKARIEAMKTGKLVQLDPSELAECPTCGRWVMFDREG